MTRLAARPKTRLGWHFLPADRMLANGDGREVKVGVTLWHKGDLDPCRSGLHASRSILDALSYAPGPVICHVHCEGPFVEHGNPVDKFVSRRRTVLWMVDGESALREFARWSALQVVHLWKAPPVVVEYLKTGKEEIRAVARTAAWQAAGDAAGTAAGGAAWDAARGAAWDAAGAAARAASGAVARGAAWGAARDAAWGAAWGAAWDAAGAAARAASGAVARGAAWGAARDAARGAARDAQEKRLHELVMAAHEKQRAGP